jgi:hypothetical protein
MLRLCEQAAGCSPHTRGQQAFAGHSFFDIVELPDKWAFFWSKGKSFSVSEAEAVKRRLGRVNQEAARKSRATSPKRQHFRSAANLVI